MTENSAQEKKVVVQKELIRESVQEASQNIRSENVLLLLMGAVTSSGDWVEEISWYDRHQGTNDTIIKIHDISQGRIPGATVVSGIGRGSFVKAIAADIAKVIDDYPGAKISIAAHSYGTKLVTKVAETFSEDQFETLFLIGSIVKESDVRRIRGRFNSIVCDCVNRDYIGYALELMSFGYYKNSSVYGLKGYKLSANRKFSGGHSELNSLQHFKEFIFPVVAGQPIVPTQSFVKSTFSEHSMTVARGILVFSLAFLVYWAFLS